MLFNDCERLVIAFFPSISASALQLYHSVLSFIPKETLLAKTYGTGQHADTSVAVIHGIVDSWDACLGTVIAHEGEPVETVDFSPDGKTVVSSGFDSTIRLWDTLTLACTLLLLFSSDTSVFWSVKYSPDGTCIVSAGDDNTIEIWDAVSGALVCTLPTRVASYAVFTPDGRRIVSYSSSDRTIEIWDSQVGTCLATLTEHHSNIASIAVSPDGRWIVSSSNDGEVYLWSLDPPYAYRVLVARDETRYSIAFTPDSSEILTAPSGDGSSGGPMSIWDVRTGMRLRELKPSVFPGTSVRCLALDPAGDEVACGMDNGTVLIMDMFSGEVKRTFAGHTQDINSLAYSRDGTRIVSCSYDGTMRVWDATKYAMNTTPAKGTSWDSGLSASANSLGCHLAAFSHDGSRLVCVYSDGTLEVERTDTWDPVCGPLSRESASFEYAALSPDGAVILTTDMSEQREMALWDTTTRSLRTHFPVGYHTSPVDYTIWGSILGYAPHCFGGIASSAMFSQDSQYLVVGSNDEALLWSVATGQLIRRFSGHTDRVTCVAFSLDATRIATGSIDESIIVWDVNTGASLVTMTSAGFVYCVAFSATGERVASGGYDKRVRVWNADTGELLHSLDGHSSSVTSVAFAPRGDVIISFADYDDRMRFWDIETGDCLHVFDREMWHLNMDVALDGTGLVVGGGRVVQLWSPPEAATPVTATAPWPPRRTWPIYYIDDGWVFSLSSAGQRTRLCRVPADWQVMTSMSHIVVFSGYRRKIDFTALQKYLDTLHGTVQ